MSNQTNHIQCISNVKSRVEVGVIKREVLQYSTNTIKKVKTVKNLINYVAPVAPKDAKATTMYLTRARVVQKLLQDIISYL